MYKTFYGLEINPFVKELKTEYCYESKDYNEVKGRLKYLNEEEVEEAFMHSRTCKVYNDSTIRINNEKYEVPYKYVGQKIEVRYYVQNEKEIIIYKDGKRCEKCKLVDVKSNSKIYRKNNIDYEKMLNKESEE